MPSYQCELCNHIFSRKNDLERHKEKKTPCVSADKIIEKHKQEIIEVKTTTDDINKIKKFLDYCHNTLRDKEGIVGMKALSNISMLLFLKFVNNSVKEGTIDLLEIEKYRKEDGSDKVDAFKNNKKYIKYVQFNNIIQDGKFKIDVSELCIIVEFIFKHILWYHPFTKNIFNDEFPSIKYETTYENIFKQMDKIDWDIIDVDIKGLAYEYFLKDEMAGGGLGQFFTRREVVDYMINVIEPYITRKSKIIDPFMGTGGFLTHIFNKIKKMYEKEDMPFTDEIKNELINGIEKNPQTCLLALNNILLNTNIFPTGVNCSDSFRNYIDTKYDICITNPPYGISGLTYDDSSMFPDEYNGIKKKEYIPHKTNDAICMSLQTIPYILNKNGIGAIVVPDGKQLTSEKEKSLIEVRKNLIENNNLFQVTKLPSGTFLPYTGVETCILFFKKGEKTKSIKFVKLDDKYKTETLICDVDIKKIKEKNYSLNYKLYIDLNKNIHTNISYNAIDELFDYIKGNIQSSKVEHVENGKYDFVTGAEEYKKVNNIENSTLIDGENVFISHRGNGDNRPIKYYNGKCYYSDLMTLLKPKIHISVKYCYYYLKFNQKHIENTYQKGACNKTLDFNLFGKMQIPVPPIEVQNVIVKELDSFYKQKESLINITNEMNIFKKAKFEMLLSACENKQTVKLGDVCDTIKTGKNKPSDGLENTKKYPYYGTGGITGYTNEYLIDGEYLLTPRNGSIGNFIKCNGKSFPSDHMYIVKPTEKILINYLYYMFMGNNLSYHKTGSIIPNITKEILYDLQIQLPSLEDQQMIINQMESYDKLVESLQKQIDEIDKIVKERFDYHLNKCKLDDEPIVEPIDKPDDELSNESKPKKIIKKVKNTKVIDEPIEIIEEVKPTKTIKVKKSVKKVLTDE